MISRPLERAADLRVGVFLRLGRTEIRQALEGTIRELEPRRRPEDAPPPLPNRTLCFTLGPPSVARALSLHQPHPVATSYTFQETTTQDSCATQLGPGNRPLSQPGPDDESRATTSTAATSLSVVSVRTHPRASAIRFAIASASDCKLNLTLLMGGCARTAMGLLSPPTTPSR